MGFDLWGRATVCYSSAGGRVANAPWAFVKVGGAAPPDHSASDIIAIVDIFRST